jgi:hypothetical protein
MIKFFRTIRQNLLMENKTRKPAFAAGRYFKYAVGEITLVVIGILIALSINNWNEARIQQQKEIVNLVELKKGLENDLITEFIPGIDKYNFVGNAAKNVLNIYNNSETFPDDSLSKYFRTSVLGEWNFIFNVATYENLKSTGIDIISNDSLRTKISSLYSNEYPELIARGERVLRYYENELRPFLQNNFNLYDSMLSKDEVENLRGNIQISNRIRSLYSQRNLLLSVAIDIKPKVETLINDIDKELKRIAK